MDYFTIEDFEKANNGDYEAMYEIVQRKFDRDYIDSVERNCNSDEYEMICKNILKYVLALADTGNVECMERAGYMFYSGDCTKVDYDKAEYYYTAALNAGSKHAKHHLMIMCVEGKLKNANLKDAYEYFSNDLNLDILFSFDELQIEKYRRDRSWDIEDVYYLAEMFRKGIYVNQNYEKAIALYEFIAENKKLYEYYYYYLACFRLGQCYHYGCGKDVDIEKAIELIGEFYDNYQNNEEDFIFLNITENEMLEELKSLEIIEEDENFAE